MKTYIFPASASWNQLPASTKVSLEGIKDSPSALANAMDYCNREQVSVLFPPYSSEVSDAGVLLRVNGYPCIQHLPGTSERKITPLGENHLTTASEKFPDLDIAQYLSTFSELYLLLAGKLANGSFRRKKRISGPFSENFQTKETGALQIKECSHPQTADYLVKEKGSGFAVLNNISLKTMLIPSSMYPMPNEKPPEVFYSQNTVSLDDGGELDSIFTRNGIRRQLGRCYLTVDSGLAALRGAGYTAKHDVAFYCGWATNIATSGWLHHAWLVIDRHSVIDLTAEKIGPFADLRNKAIVGEVPITDREKLANAMKRFEREPHSIQELIHYGQCKDWCYIGVPSDREEGIDAFNKLLQKYPEHPEYRNINKTDYTNALNRAYYGL